MEAYDLLGILLRECCKRRSAASWLLGKGERLQMPCWLRDPTDNSRRLGLTLNNNSCVSRPRTSRYLSQESVKAGESGYDVEGTGMHRKKAARGHAIGWVGVNCAGNEDSIIA
jgi:hypothetical protein